MTVFISKSEPYVFVFEKTTTSSIYDDEDGYISYEYTFIIVINNSFYFYTKNNLSNPWTFSTDEKLRKHLEYSINTFKSQGYDLIFEDLYTHCGSIKLEKFIWKQEADKEWDVL